MASSSSSSPDYAGFWQRAAALLIDWLIVIVVTVPVMVLGFGMREVSLDPAEHSWDLLAFLAIAIMVVGFWKVSPSARGWLGWSRRCCCEARLGFCMARPPRPVE